MVTLKDLWDTLNSYDGGKYDGKLVVLFELDGTFLGDRVAFSADPDGGLFLTISASYGGDGTMCLTYNGLVEAMADVWPPEMGEKEVRFGEMRGSRRVNPTREVHSLSIGDDIVECDWKTILTLG